MDKKKLVGSVIIDIVFLVIMLTFYTTFSLEEEYQFDSVVYSISDGEINGISPYTKIDLFLDYFDCDNCKIKVVKLDNEEIVNGYVMDGSKTILMDMNGKVITTYSNVVMGDYDANGVVDNLDLEGFGRRLIENSFDERMKNSLDVDSDNEIHMNDLILLDKVISSGYQELNLVDDNIILQSNEVGRIGYSVTPGYGKNTNLKWSSNNTDVVIVRESGAMVGRNEGEAIVRAEVIDGSLFKEIKVKVDNTIQLESYEGVGYIGGSDVEVGIKSVNYDNITCSSSDSKIASCEIVGKKLVMKALEQGNVVINVSSSKYGEVSYKLETYSVYLNVMPKYFCTTPGNVQFITVSGFFTGELSFEMNNKNIINNAYMDRVNERNMLRIELGSKQGRGILTVKESNGNVSNNVVIDVSRISIPEIGSFAKIGQEVSTTIVGDNIGTLSCTSEDVSKATCKIDGNQLIVTPLAFGSVTIEVLNQFTYNGNTYNCDKSQFLVVIQE